MVGEVFRDGAARGGSVAQQGDGRGPEAWGGEQDPVEAAADAARHGGDLGEAVALQVEGQPGLPQGQGWGVGVGGGGINCSQLRCFQHSLVSPMG